MTDTTPAERADIARLKFDLRQAMIDYGQAIKNEVDADILATSQRGVDLVDQLAALAAAPQAQQSPAQNYALQKTIERGCSEPRVCAYHKTCMGDCAKPLEDARTAACLRRTDATPSPSPAHAPVEAERRARRASDWPVLDGPLGDLCP